LTRASLRGALVVVVLASATAGCSWLIGVSEDPIAADGFFPLEAGEEDDSAIALDAASPDDDASDGAMPVDADDAADDALPE
jgi:hypothetical protein